MEHILVAKLSRYIILVFVRYRLHKIRNPSRLHTVCLRVQNFRLWEDPSWRHALEPFLYVIQR